jgi:hypothetical protein
VADDKVNGAQSKLPKVIAFVVELGAWRCPLEQLQYRRDQLESPPPAFNVIT